MEQKNFLNTLRIYLGGLQKSGVTRQMKERDFAMFLSRGNVPLGQGRLTTRETLSKQCKQYAKILKRCGQ